MIFTFACFATVVIHFYLLLSCGSFLSYFYAVVTNFCLFLFCDYSRLLISILWLFTSAYFIDLVIALVFFDGCLFNSAYFYAGVIQLCFLVCGYYLLLILILFCVYFCCGYFLLIIYLLWLFQSAFFHGVVIPFWLFIFCNYFPRIFSRLCLCTSACFTYVVIIFCLFPCCDYPLLLLFLLCLSPSASFSVLIILSSYFSTVIIDFSLDDLLCLSSSAYFVAVLIADSLYLCCGYSILLISLLWLPPFDILAFASYPIFLFLCLFHRQLQRFLWSTFLHHSMCEHFEINHYYVGNSKIPVSFKECSPRFS